MDPSREAILSLYNHFKLCPDAIYTWVNSSPSRKEICQNKLIRSSLLQYDVCCKLLFTLFQEHAPKLEDTYFNGTKALLLDLKRANTCAFLCEVYIDKRLAHIFIIQRTVNLTFYLYQSHPNHYTLFESLEKLDLEPVNYENLSITLKYLDSKLSSYVQSITQQLFHFPVNADSFKNLSLIYKRCNYIPFDKISLPQPPNQSRNFLIIFFMVSTFMALIVFINLSNKRIRK